jgi:hypothetical protein
VFIKKLSIIDRDDGIINLCEIKFIEKPFAIDETYDRVLMSKRETSQLS